MSGTAHKNQVVVLSAGEINASLQDTDRQYLQGNLKIPQTLSYVYSERCEIGISDYDSYRHDDPHYHDSTTETNYIISGKICLRMIETGEDFIIGPGGVFSVPPKMPHILKIQPGTRIIFVKDHALNDKHVLDYEALDLEQWFADRNF